MDKYSSYGIVQVGYYNYFYIQFDSAIIKYFINSNKVTGTDPLPIIIVSTKPKAQGVGEKI